MYIATEDQPSYINPVRERGATSKILASYADGKTLREVILFAERLERMDRQH